MPAEKPTIISILNGPPSATLLRDLSERLKMLAKERETKETRAEIDAALGCKWWDMRKKAIGVVGTWGGKANKKWLLDLARRPLVRGDIWARRRKGRYRWDFEETRTAREAVWRLLDETDADWLLDMWFGGEEMGYLAYAVVMRIPTHKVAPRIAAELAGTDYHRRKAALNLIFDRRTYPDREQILRRHLRDKDPNIARRAEELLRWDERLKKHMEALAEQSSASGKRQVTSPP